MKQTSLGKEHINNRLIKIRIVYLIKVIFVSEIPEREEEGWTEEEENKDDIYSLSAGGTRTGL